MWTSEPPASTSSRSRQASTWTRRSPADGGEIADLGDGIGGVGHGVAHRWSSSPPQAGPSAGRWRSPHRSAASAAFGPRVPDRPYATDFRASAPTLGGGAPDSDGAAVSSSDDSHDTLRRCRLLDEALDGVEGWFSPEQVARVVEPGPSEVPPTGRIVEIGSFRGRSMIAIARSAPAGAEIVAIDPHAGNDRGPQEIEGFEDEAAGRPQGVPRQPRAGRRARPGDATSASSATTPSTTCAAPIDLLHIDGAHRFTPAGDDIAPLGRPGRPTAGSMLVHDSFSSVGVTLALGDDAEFSGDVALRGPQPVAGRVPPRAGPGRGPAGQRRPPAGPAPVVRSATCPSRR